MNGSIGVSSGDAREFTWSDTTGIWLSLGCKREAGIDCDQLAMSQ